jgi:prepilin-type N-terminal cleavage/methylation domain-containing protein
MKQCRTLSSRGFTIVELLIVITIIAILAAIVIVAYNGIQERARNSTRISSITSVQQLIETYNAQNGEYPKTTNNPKANWRASDVLTDDNCTNGSSQADWIPGIPNLPQSDPIGGSGVDGITGCYLYVSNGQEYVISAWNMVTKPQISTLYRRLGFREFQTSSSTQFYTCNSNTVGGATGGYDSNEDYYKHSYTVSNISDCDETPPGGA